ncbi:MAG: hypothetical protein ACJA0Z_000248 [Halioglobus sp.]
MVETIGGEGGETTEGAETIGSSIVGGCGVGITTFGGGAMTTEGVEATAIFSCFFPGEEPSHCC